MKRFLELNKSGWALTSVAERLQKPAAQALATLARRLENLAFVSPPDVLDEILQLLRILRR
jgi:hypothetical protein